MPRPRKKPPNRGDNRYEKKITIGKALDGHLIRKSFYSTISLADCDRQIEEYKEAKKAENFIDFDYPNESPLFKDWAKKWLVTYKKKIVKDNTLEGTYRIPVEKHLIPYFGEHRLSQIKSVHVQRFFKQKGEKYAYEYLKKMHSCLKAIFDTAIENDLCFKNPVTKNIKLVSSIATKPKQVYTEEQYETVLDFAYEHPLGLDIAVLLETGISRSELLGILMDGDVDFKRNIIYIEQGLVEQKNSDTSKWEIVVDGLKNNYRRRPIPIPQRLSDRLASKSRVIYVGGNKKKNIPGNTVRPKYMFHSPNGLPYSPNNWYKRVYKVFMQDMQKKYSDIPFLTPHELRHSVATILNFRTGDVFSIAKLLGHVNLDMLSKRYAHPDVEVIRKRLKIGCEKE